MNRTTLGIVATIATFGCIRIDPVELRGGARVWSVETVAEAGVHGSLAIAPDGTPSALYVTEPAGLWFAHRIDGQWRTEPVDADYPATSIADGATPQLAFLAGRHAQVLYGRGDPAQGYVLWIAASAMSGGDWNRFPANGPLTASPTGESFALGTARVLGVAYYANALAYGAPRNRTTGDFVRELFSTEVWEQGQRERACTQMTLDNDEAEPQTWFSNPSGELRVAPGADGPSAVVLRDAGPCPSVARSIDGIIHICDVTDVLRYARVAEGAVQESLETDMSADARCSVALDSSGEPFVASARANGEVVLFSRGAGLWRGETVTTAHDPTRMSLAVDSAGAAHLLVVDAEGVHYAFGR